MNLRQVIHFFLIIALFGCESSFINVLSDKEVEQITQYLEEENNSHIDNIVLIKDNDVYLMRDADKNSLIKLTEDSGNERENVKISYDNQKIIYFEENVGVVFIDTAGNILDIADDILEFDQMDWLPDNESIYYLNNNKLFAYGSDREFPELTINVFGQYKRIISASVSTNGDIAYIQAYNGTYGTDTRLYVKLNDENQTNFYTQGNPEYPNRLAYVNFSPDGESMILGYQHINYDTYPVKVEIYEDPIDESPIKTYENSYGLATPCFSKELNYLISGYGTSSDGEISLTCFNLENSDKSFWYNEILITELDWK